MFYDLYTPEGEALTGVPWPDYPRPRLRRDSFFNLNGLWEFTARPGSDLPERYDRTIQVPFCPESLLSGIHTHFPEGWYLFYRRRFTLPEGFIRSRVLLQIGAADQVLDAWLNGVYLGSHTGGYEHITFAITGALDAENELVLRVRDDLRDNRLPYGKQTLKRGGMWYTPVSGVWQTVWLESVPDRYIRQLDVRADTVRAVLDTGDAALTGTVTVQTPDGVLTVPLERGRAQIAPPSPRLWSPEDPYLYACTIQAGEDRVESYFALRTVEIRQVGGYARLCLNGEPYFFHGVLDQGYYSDGLFTPASPACYERDIRAMQALGFNTLRKHIKVEPDIFYTLCDRLGMVVFQDMVNNGDYRYLRDTVLPTAGWQRRRSDGRMHRDPAARAAFLAGMEATVAQLKPYPCILYWTIFNEGWGQFEAGNACRRLRELDDSRIIDSTSGWFRGGETDVDSRHIYFGPWKLDAGEKPLVLSEFGGCCLPVEGHMFHPDKAYGYSSCKTREEFARAIQTLYERRVLPVVAKGLCAAIYTQLSDVEDEINGLVTYDRRAVKLDQAPMRELAARLRAALGGKEPFPCIKR